MYTVVTVIRLSVMCRATSITISIISSSTVLCRVIWQLFQFLNPTHSRQDPLGGSSDIRKAATYTQNNTHSVALVRQRTIPTEQPPLVGEVSAKSRINTHRYPCLEWDSNPWSPCFSERRQFMPWTARPLWSVISIIYTYIYIYIYICISS
jgi:hypothetical protein